MSIPDKLTRSGWDWVCECRCVKDYSKSRKGRVKVVSKPDRFDEQAEALLPCMCSRLPPVSATWHLEAGHKPTCPAGHRPAVAAALRELGNIRDLLIRSLMTATGATKEAVIHGPFTTACEHAKRVERLEGALKVVLEWASPTINKQYDDVASARAALEEK